ncbi:MAG TPA: RidA family protein [Acidimicrobiia bacterium]|nr:RidA family protein [Acidimicrobiia bacterium]
MKRSRLLVIVAVGGLSGVGLWAAAPSRAENSPPVEHLNEDPASGAPFSDAVRVGSTLYLAGNLGLDKSGKLVPGGITPEADQALQNLTHVLERNGSTLDRVGNCEVMLADIKERDAFNDVYKKYWAPGQFPARHAFGVTGLYLGARVELACIAALK